MKKEEAKLLAPERAKLIIEYITQILSDEDKVKGQIDFSFAKIEKEEMCTFEISVSSKKFERHLNTGITLQQSDVLNEQILNDLIENFIDSEEIGITPFFSIKSTSGRFNGIKCYNLNGSEIHLNFQNGGQRFEVLKAEYNQKLKDYRNQENAKIMNPTNDNVPHFPRFR